MQAGKEGSLPVQPESGPARQQAERVPSSAQELRHRVKVKATDADRAALR